jgi:hypothetical protein
MNSSHTNKIVELLKQGHVVVASCSVLEKVGVVFNEPSSTGVNQFMTLGNIKAHGIPDFIIQSNMSLADAIDVSRAVAQSLTNEACESLSQLANTARLTNKDTQPLVMEAQSIQKTNLHYQVQLFRVNQLIDSVDDDFALEVGNAVAWLDFIIVRVISTIGVTDNASI